MTEYDGLTSEQIKQELLRATGAMDVEEASQGDNSYDWSDPRHDAHGLYLQEQAELQEEEEKRLEERTEDEEDEFNLEDYRGVNPLVDAELDRQKAELERQEEMERKEAELIESYRAKKQAWDDMDIRSKRLNPDLKPTESAEVPPELAKRGAQAFEQDREDLENRYHDYRPFVEKFIKKFESGQLASIKGITDDDIVDVPNLHEKLFIEWFTQTPDYQKMDYRQQETFLNTASLSVEDPLLCRAVDTMIPGHAMPKPKPKPQGRQPTAKAPVIDEGDLIEMLGDFFRKHPDRLR